MWTECVSTHTRSGVSLARLPGPKGWCAPLIEAVSSSAGPYSVDHDDSCRPRSPVPALAPPLRDAPIPSDVDLASAPIRWNQAGPSADGGSSSQVSPKLPHGEPWLVSQSGPLRDTWPGGRGRRLVVLARLPRLPARARLERAAHLHNGRTSQAGQPMRRGRGQGRRATNPVSASNCARTAPPDASRAGVSLSGDRRHRAPCPDELVAEGRMDTLRVAD